MRHVRSVLYAIVLAPAIWALCAVGLGWDNPDRARGDALTLDGLGGLGVLMLAGAAYALLILPRFAPIGPLLAGLTYLGMAAWFVVAPTSFDGLWPAAVTRADLDLRLPAQALAVLLAVPLLATAAMPHRWRRRRAPVSTPNVPHGPYPEVIAPPMASPGEQTVSLPTHLAAQLTRLSHPAETTQVIPLRRDAEATRRITVTPPPGDATVRIVPPPVISPTTPVKSAEPVRSGEKADPTPADPSGEETRRIHPVAAAPGGSPQMPEPPVPPQEPDSDDTTVLNAPDPDDEATTALAAPADSDSKPDSDSEPDGEDATILLPGTSPNGRAETAAKPAATSSEEKEDEEETRPL